MDNINLLGIGLESMVLQTSDKYNFEFPQNSINKNREGTYEYEYKRK